MKEESPKNNPNLEEEFYTSLKEKLEHNHNFPEDYLFKFIFPNDPSKMVEIYQIFDPIKYSITSRESKNGKYLSVSILAFVLDADQVINLYKKVSEIDGVIML